MHVPPVVRGGLALRSVVLVAGLALCALGIVVMIEAGIGLSPWDVLQQGISERTPLSFGLANVAVGLVVIVLAHRLGARIGPGTVANATLIGLLVDLFSSWGAMQSLATAPLGARIGLLVAALVLFGVGTAMYIGADLGAGPRDSLMLVLAVRTRTRISVVRAGIEVAVTALGFALGGTLGFGTAAFAIGIGPAVELGFWLVVVTGMACPPRSLVPATATINAR